jgi:putative acyl-CoA dehydrogenase
MPQSTPSPWRTHEVFNQPKPLVNYNLYQCDSVLPVAVRQAGGAFGQEMLAELGNVLGQEATLLQSFQANEFTPVLHTHDRFGHRLDEVSFHPAWHEFMRLAVSYGLHCLPWEQAQPGAHVVRAALMMLMGQVECGHLCPISMTYSAVPTLSKQPQIAAQWLPKINSRQYDSRLRPLGEKSGAILGMAMTEKQGGSDVRANTTRAVAQGQGEYLITGHKWFCSAPMSDAFLVLAQTPAGLSCFLLPRWTPQGEKNGFYLQRLKNKLGNRSNASSEVEFVDAWAQLIGEEGRGVPTIIEMVTHTRLDCVIAATAVMRQAWLQAYYHATERAAFGQKLVDQPLMQNVLADLYLEVESAIWLMIRLAQAFDRRETNEEEKTFQRLATAIAKYWICKRAPHQVVEALECLGGNGYVEDAILARLYREIPLYSIWEGSGNVICLDVLRAINKEPATVPVLLAELRQACGVNNQFDTFLAQLESQLHSTAESQARCLVENCALALQASLLLRYGQPTVAAAFCATRLTANGSYSFGTLPVSVADISIILQHARPW